VCAQFATHITMCVLEGCCQPCYKSLSHFCQAVLDWALSLFLPYDSRSCAALLGTENDCMMCIQSTAVPLFDD